jgi:ornithine carbamoyltransferase
VKTPTSTEKVITKARSAFKSVPVINTLTNWLKPFEMSKDQQTLSKMEKFTEKVSKMGDK